MACGVGAPTPGVDVDAGADDGGALLDVGLFEPAAPALPVFTPCPAGSCTRTTI